MFGLDQVLPIIQEYWSTSKEIRLRHSKCISFFQLTCATGCAQRLREYVHNLKPEYYDEWEQRFILLTELYNFSDNFYSLGHDFKYSLKYSGIY